MTDELSISDVMPVSIERLYRPFLSSAEHSAMTGARATASDEVGGTFIAWDGYIQGENLVLEPNQRIVQSWRAADFPKHNADSRLEIIFASRGPETEITFIHTGLPSGMGDGFTEGWQKYYLVPMRAYFARHLYAELDDAIADGSPPSDAHDVARKAPASLSTEPAPPSKKSPRGSAKARPRGASSKALSPSKIASKKTSSAKAKPPPKKASAKKASAAKVTAKRVTKKVATKKPRAESKAAASKKKGLPKAAAASKKRAPPSAKATAATKKSSRKSRP